MAFLVVEPGRNKDKVSQSISSENGELDGSFPLLPIQKAFLEGHFNDLNYYNKSQLLVLSGSFDASCLKPILSALLSHHDMLRAKFINSEEEWEGYYQPFNQELVETVLQRVDLDEIIESERSECIEYCCSKTQVCLDISRGELIKVVYFDGLDQPQLFIVVHHLVFDELSWFIFLSDFEDAYLQFKNGEKIMLGEKKTSFRQFANKISSYSNSEKSGNQKEYWLNNLSNIWAGVLPFDKPDYVSNKNCDAKSISINWSNSITCLLLKNCVEVYKIEVNMLLLTALLKAIEKINGHAVMRVAFNSHDRESITDGVDLNKTIGWLTYEYPLNLYGNDQSEWPELIRTVKEQCRNVPQKGIGYGVLRYLQEDADIINLTKHPESWIKFNYSGQIDQLVKNDSICFSIFSFGNKGLDRNPFAFRENNLAFNGAVINGQLQFSLDYNPLQYHEQTMQRLAVAFKQALEDIVAHCLEPGVGGYTPSDFPLANLSQFEIEDLEIKYSNIHDVYPATGIQLGFLLHNHAHPGAYINQFIFSFNGRLDSALWKRSWELLIIEHSILRTVFVGEYPSLYQVVLSEIKLPWTLLDWREKNISQQEEDFRQFTNTTRMEDFFIDRAPLMNVHLIQLSEENYRFIWNIHGALLDEGNIPIIWSKLKTYYRNLLEKEDISVRMEIYPYKNYVSWFCKQDIASARLFWRKYLSSLETITPFLTNPAIGNNANAGMYQEYILGVPKSLRTGIQNLSNDLGINVNTIIQVAWAYLLYAYTKEKLVCFGITVSERPVEVVGIEEIVGLFTNHIPTIVEFEDLEVSIENYLQKIHKGQQAQKQYSYLPLIEIKKESSITGEELFNTLLIFESSSHIDSLDKEFVPDLCLEEYEGKVLTAFPLSLKVLSGDKIAFKLVYRTGNFNKNRIEFLGTQFIEVLKVIIENSRKPLGSIDIIVGLESQVIPGGLQPAKNNLYESSENDEGGFKKGGDAGVKFQDTHIEFSGRTEHHVKIRGFRVDLRRIESQLLAIDGVEKAVVIAKEDTSGNKKLIGYLVVSENLVEERGKDFFDKIKDSLFALPRYMMPDSYVFLDTFPVDGIAQGNALDTFEKVQRSSIDIILPRNKIEQIVAEIWQDVLGLDRVSIYDNFFELGGDSFKVTRVLSMIKDQGLMITTIELYESSTIAQIADRVQKNDVLNRLKVSGEVKGLGCFLSFHLLFFKYIKYDVWNISRIYHFKSGLNQDVIKEVLINIYAYHDALRINFKGKRYPESNMRNLKIINLGVEELKPDFIVKDWTSLDHELFMNKVKDDIDKIEANNTFDSKNLAAFRIYRGEDGDHFYLMASHLICDGISFEILIDDIFNWYEILNSGGEINFKRKTDSYILATKKNFDYANSEEILKELPFWMDVYSSFSKNILFPRDYVISKEERILKNCIIVKEILLSDSDLKSIEIICTQNNTTVVDLILTTVGQAIKEWSGINKFGVLFISSGRQFTQSNIDVSRTFGCFTGANHVKVDNSNEELSLIEKATLHKRNRDGVPQNGLTSTLLLELMYYRGLDYNSPLLQKIFSSCTTDAPNVSFNYFDNRKPKNEGDIKDLVLSPCSILFSNLNNENEFLDLFRFELYHTNDNLKLEWTYNGLEYKKETINEMVYSIKKSLTNIIPAKLA